MTPQEYCAQLEQALAAMPPEERQETLCYYQEFLEEASQEERDALGTPQQLAQKILRENGIPLQPPQPQILPQHESTTENTLLKVILLLVSAPIWFSLLIAFVAVLFSLAVCLIAIPISLAAILLACLVTFGILLLQDLPGALYALGIALIIGGLTVLLTKPILLGCKYLFRFLGFSCKKLWQAVFPKKQ